MANQPVKKILRIGLFLGGDFIEERHIRQTQAVSVGQDFKKNTFVIPQGEFPKSVVLFDVKDGKFIACFDQNMSGKVSFGDDRKTLGQLVTEKRAKKGAQGYRFQLEQNMYGRIAFGSGKNEVAFLFQFVTPPPPRAKPVLPASMRGGIINGVLGSVILAITCGISGVLQIGFVAFLLSRDWPKPRDLDYQIPDRFVKIMIDKDEEEPIEPDPTEVIEGEGEPEAKEEEPAGSDEKEKEEPKTAEDRAAEEADRNRRMAEEVQNKTILSQLGAIADGGDLLSTLNDGAGKTSMDAAFADSTGLKSGVQGEKSGLQSAGSSSANGTGKSAGIGDLKGLDGAGKANKVTTGKKTEKKVRVRVKLKGPQKVVGLGKLDGSSISKVIKRRQAAIQKCYEREIKKNPKASGKVIVAFTIGTAGRVTKSKATKDGVGGGVGPCVAKVIKRMKFPKPEGGEVIVNKTFVFEVAN